MNVEINGDKRIEVIEDFLSVKGKTLYNEQTKKREGLDGDIVSFVKNENVIVRGTVDGYTCGNKVKLRGIDTIYDNVKNIKFEHISVVTNSDAIDFEEKELLMAES